MTDIIIRNVKPADEPRLFALVQRILLLGERVSDLKNTLTAHKAMTEKHQVLVNARKADVKDWENRLEVAKKEAGDLAKKHSNGVLRLFTLETNTKAQRFYERHGFKIIRRGFEEFWQLADIEYEWVRDSSS